MERLIIKGGNQLHGDVNCSGAKNAGLPIIAATILLEKTIEIENWIHMQTSHKITMFKGKRN